MRPTASPPARPAANETARASRAAERLGRRLRRLLGLRQSFVVDGVRYRELTTEPLRRALSRKGSGAKEYDVRFPSGHSMRIHATPARIYADLVGRRPLSIHRLAEPVLTPGARVLALKSGTGDIGAWLSERVGPSGAVVALEPDEESIQYAQHRYRVANVAFEVGDAGAVAGEVDGSFDGIIAVDTLRRGPDEAAQVRELWRLVAPAGWLLLAARTRQPDAPEDSDSHGWTAEELMDLLTQASRDLSSSVSSDSDDDEHDVAPSTTHQPQREAPLSGVLANALEGYAVVIAARPAED